MKPSQQCLDPTSPQVPLNAPDLRQLEMTGEENWPQSTGVCRLHTDIWPLSTDLTQCGIWGIMTIGQ
jgi:hypothetical protein